MRLKDKVALVTGASRGIGRGIAEIFAEEGAHVCVNYTSNADGRRGGRRLGQEQGPPRHHRQGRRRQPRLKSRRWSIACGASSGPIDILVNNAGIETIVPFLELTDEQWTRLTDVNLRGNWLCSQVYCRRAIAEKRPGSIVNIGSIQAAKVLPGRTHYAPTKLGLEALTRNMSAEMTPLGIRVNCVHPGLIETDMTDWVMKSPDILPHGPGADLARPRRPAARSRHGRRLLRVRRSELPDRAVRPRRRRLAGQVTHRERPIPHSVA